MAFEIKYDANGVPLKGQEPKFEEVSAATEDQSTPLESLSAEQPVEQEVTEHVVEQEQPQPVQNTLEKQPSGPRESWKALREKALAAEKRAQELEAALLAAQSQKNPTAQEEDEEEISEVAVDADALVEGKHLSKVNKHIKKLEQQLKQYQQQTALSATEIRLKSQYPDFDKVVSRDNLESLRLAYPEIAQSLNANPDLYGKAVSAYTMIKKLGIGEEDPYVEEKAIIQRNALKPKPLASINPQQGDSPLSKANAFANGKLTDELKAQMLKEMNEYRNR